MAKPMGRAAASRDRRRPATISQIMRSTRVEPAATPSIALFPRSLLELSSYRVPLPPG